MRKKICLMVLIFSFLGSCIEGESKKEGRFLYNKFIYIPIEKIYPLRLGADTYRDLTDRYGESKYGETIFGKYILPRKIGEDYYPVDRILSYFGTISEKNSKEDGKNIINRIQTKERQTVSLFFYKNRLIDFSVFNEYYIASDSPKTALGKNATLDVENKHKKKKGDIGTLWPEAYCDNKYYFYKSGREKEHVETYLAEPCDWEESDFETKLRKGNYYEHKREMDQGDYSHLIRVQSTLPKWSECPLPNGLKCN